MPHIHTKPGQHDHTASAFIIRTDYEEPKLMLHMHKKLGMYLQFGGHIELDETPWQTLAHELREESGYAIEQLTLLQPKERVQNMAGVAMHPIPFSYNTHKFNGTHFHTDVAFGFITNKAPRNQPDANESTNMILLTRKELAELPANKVYDNVRQCGLFLFDTFLISADRVAITDFA